MRSILYIFAINIKRWIYYIQRYESHNMKNWRIKVKMNLSCSQFKSSFSQSSVVVVMWFSVSEFAINQNASINKNSKSTNSRSLKQHTSAKSISLYCFCFCFVREIDRFIILICRYLLHRSKSRFSTKFSFRCFRIYLFSFFLFSHVFYFRIYFFTSIAFVLKIFNFNNSVSRYLHVVNEFFRNVDRLEEMK